MSDADEQITATIVADGNLGVTISSPSDNLKANIDSEGNLVANRLSIGPDTQIDSLSNVNFSQPVVDNAYLQYDKNLNSWHNSTESIEQTIDNRKPEVYEFTRHFGYSTTTAGNSVNFGAGFPVPTGTVFQGPSFGFFIPKPKGGYAKRQKLKITVDYSYSAYETTNVYGSPYIEFEELVQYNQTSTLPLSFEIVDIQPSEQFGPFTGARDFYVRGNHIDKLNTITGRVSLTSNSGSNINSVTGLRFLGDSVFGTLQSTEGFTIITATDNNQLLSVGDTLYYSNTNFIDGNFVSFTAPLHKKYRKTFHPANTNPVTTNLVISEAGSIQHEHEMILPATQQSRSVVWRCGVTSNIVGNASNIYLHRIHIVAENL